MERQLIIIGIIIMISVIFTMMYGLQEQREEQRFREEHEFRYIIDTEKYSCEERFEMKTYNETHCYTVKQTPIP